MKKKSCSGVFISNAPGFRMKGDKISRLNCQVILAKIIEFRVYFDYSNEKSQKERKKIFDEKNPEKIGENRKSTEKKLMKK